MKLLRYREEDIVKPGVIDKTEKIRDVSSIITDWNNETINNDHLEKIMKLDLSNLDKVPKARS